MGRPSRETPMVSTVVACAPAHSMSAHATDATARYLKPTRRSMCGDAFGMPYEGSMCTGGGGVSNDGWVDHGDRA